MADDAQTRQTKRQVDNIKRDIEKARSAPAGDVEQAALKELMRHAQMLQKQFPSEYKKILDTAAKELNSEFPDAQQLLLDMKDGHLIIDNPKTDGVEKLKMDGAGGGTVVLVVEEKDGSTREVEKPDHPMGSVGQKPKSGVKR